MEVEHPYFQLFVSCCDFDITNWFCREKEDRGGGGEPANPHENRNQQQLDGDASTKDDGKHVYVIFVVEKTLITADE